MYDFKILNSGVAKYEHYNLLAGQLVNTPSFAFIPLSRGKK